jgi:GNAT superfamily N-acetyltransferase
MHDAGCGRVAAVNEDRDEATRDHEPGDVLENADRRHASLIPATVIAATLRRSRKAMVLEARGTTACMASELPDVVVRIADETDTCVIASLRSLWSADVAEADPDFETRMGAWLVGEGDRRTTWLATLGDSPVGMASLFEYRRMPRPGVSDSRWGYVGNLFVREGVRNRGIGSALLTRVATTADERGYARLVLSPSAKALPFFQRAGFIVPDGTEGDRLLVRPGPAG